MCDFLCMAVWATTWLLWILVELGDVQWNVIRMSIDRTARKFPDEGLCKSAYSNMFLLTYVLIMDSYSFSNDSLQTD